MTLHIIFFTFRVTALQYGVGTYLEQLFFGLGELNKNVVIHQIVFQHDLKQKITTRRINTSHTVYYIKKDGDFNPTFNEEFCENTAELLKKYFDKLSNTILHVNLPHTLPLARCFKKYFNIPIISVVHLTGLLEPTNKKFLTSLEDILINLKSYSFSDLEVNLKYLLQELMLYQLSDKIICLNKEIRDVLIDTLKVSKRKVALIPNGYDIIRIDREGDTIDNSSLRKKFHINQNEKLLIYAGRVSIQKGTDVLINSFRQVLEKSSNCRLIIAGDCSRNFSSYLSICNDIWAKITFTGFLDKDKLLDLYRIADLAIFPSLKENCSYAILELMAAEVPFICTNISGVKELIEDQNDPLVVNLRSTHSGDKYLDSEDLYQKIIFAISNINILKENAKRLKKKFEADHRRHHMIVKTVKEYKTLI